MVAKRIYFDTNIYRRLTKTNHQNLKETIVTAHTNKLVQVISGAFNLEEILANKDPAEVRETLNLVITFMHGGSLFKQLPEIIKGEVNFVLNGMDYQPLYPENEAKQQYDVLIRCISENNSLPAPKELYLKVRDSKKRFLNDTKKFMEKINLPWEQFKDKPFGHLWQGVLSNTETAIFIKEVSERASGQAITDENVQTILLSIEQTPVLRALLLWECLAIYRYHQQAQKPKWGDNHDNHHIVTASYADIFVTEDSGILEFVQPAGSLYGVELKSLMDFAKYCSSCG